MGIPHVLYHATPACYWPQILREGIHAFAAVGRFRSALQNVYLSDSMGYAETVALGKCQAFMLPMEIVVMKLKKKSIPGVRLVNPHEYVSNQGFQVIPAKSICKAWRVRAEWRGVWQFERERITEFLGEA